MLAIGLMSGTSLDGVDASLIETDGDLEINFIKDQHIPYPIEFQIELKDVLNNKKPWWEVEKRLTDYHATAVSKLLSDAGVNNSTVEVIGFHGQTIYHNPLRMITWQIGNPHYLAFKTGINVVSDFRRRDVAHGGQGAPLIPIFHKCLMRNQKLPVAVLNIGGVANITYLDKDKIIAFDTGPGNALINDAMMQFWNKPFDYNGEVALQGTIDYDLINQVLEDNYFMKPPPKSLDRNAFSVPKTLGKYDLVSTLTMLTVQSIIKSLTLLPKIPNSIFVCGGGGNNLTLMSWLKQETSPISFENIKEIGPNPDFIESQGFGYLAVRYLMNLPSSFPTTTGASQEIPSGVLFQK
jgi:anhydro-N-acetylmuramic acid kinase